MRMLNITAEQLMGFTVDPPTRCRVATVCVDIEAGESTLSALRARDTDAQPPTLAELQALGLDELAVAIAAATAPA